MPTWPAMACGGLVVIAGEHRDLDAHIVQPWMASQRACFTVSAIGDHALTVAVHGHQHGGLGFRLQPLTSAHSP